MSKLIIDEYPLLVLPLLASTIGLNEAIALQQIHYWLDPRINKNYKEGSFWIYNTYEEWQKQFTFWSVRTIRRIIKSLESKGILISKTFNLNNFDKTKWYSIDYAALVSLNICKSLLGQVGTSSCSNWTKDKDKLATTYKETETTTKTTISNSLSSINLQIEKSIKEEINVEKQEREKEMIKIWSEVIEKGNQATIQLTTNRTHLLALRLKEFFNNDTSKWKDFCKKITSSKFLMGEVTRFKVQLDWVLKEENILKIIENSYGMGDRIVDKEDFSIETLEDNIIDPLWKKTRLELKKKLGEGLFNSWISKLQFIGISENIAHFISPTKFISEWIVNNFSEDIKREFNSYDANVYQIIVK